MLDVTRLLNERFDAAGHLRYGHQGERPRRPVVVWTLTQSCNLRCLHCYADAVTGKVPGELSFAEVSRILEQLSEVGVAALLLSGGEPLVRGDIFDIASLARQMGIPTTLSSNGTLIDGRMAERIKQAGFRYVGISLDGLEERNDLFRGSRGAFRRALAGIRNCKAVGQKVGLRLTLTSHTVSDLYGIFRLVEEEGIERVCFYHLVYSGRGRGIQDTALSPHETRQAVEAIFQQAWNWLRQGSNIEVLTVDNHADGPFLYLWASHHLGADRAQRIRTLLSKNGGNNSGVALVHIDNMGRVHPDQFTWGHVVGDLRRQTFREIWLDPSHQLLRQLRDRHPLLPEKCRRCPFLDICNGNFRARAWGATGDFWGMDPGCYLTEEETARAA
jgi:radical SAM protein with 4Fe4S-binding SPASM domain